MKNAKTNCSIAFTIMKYSNSILFLIRGCYFLFIILHFQNIACLRVSLLEKDIHNKKRIIFSFYILIVKLRVNVMIKRVFQYIILFLTITMYASPHAGATTIPLLNIIQILRLLLLQKNRVLNIWWRTKQIYYANFKHLKRKERKSNFLCYWWKSTTL